MSSHTRSKEKLQIAFVYLLVGFLMAQDTKKIIDTFYFQLVSNLELFDNYTVGHMCYDLKLDYLKFDFKTKNHEWIRKNKKLWKSRNFMFARICFRLEIPSFFFLLVFF